MQAPGHKYKFLCKRGKNSKKSLSTDCVFVNNMGANLNYSARAHHVATKESDWMIYERAFLLLCYVTKDSFQLQNKNRLIQLCFAEERKSLLKKSTREAFSILLREREEEIGS